MDWASGHEIVIGEVHILYAYQMVGGGVHVRRAGMLRIDGWRHSQESLKGAPTAPRALCTVHAEGRRGRGRPAGSKGRFPI